jgi:hypothetical protein
MTTRRRNLALAALLATGAVVIAVVGIRIQGAHASPSEDLQAVKAASARYHSLEQAKEAGYSTAGEPCVSAPPPPGVTGAMGIHAVNSALVQDPAIDPLHPEIMLYLPNGDGKLDLVGVEYFRVALANTESGAMPWLPQTPPPLGFADSAPVVLGYQLDGPMPGHNPTMPWHYDLHVWLWADNPAGVFAQFNPNLSCPP